MSMTDEEVVDVLEDLKRGDTVEIELDTSATSLDRFQPSGPFQVDVRFHRTERDEDYLLERDDGTHEEWDATVHTIELDSHPNDDAEAYRIKFDAVLTGDRVVHSMKALGDEFYEDGEKHRSVSPIGGIDRIKVV